LNRRLNRQPEKAKDQIFDKQITTFLPLFSCVKKRANVL